MIAIKQIFTLSAIILLTTPVIADINPTISHTAKYTNSNGEEEESTAYSGSAPITGKFAANTSNLGSWNAHYEWRFYTEGNSASPYIIRYEQDTEYTFTKAGTNYIELYATFTQGTDTVAYTANYWSETNPMSITISESKLDMPNAFSPNGDGINDVYKAKDGYQSIIEFHAYIFNRWGQQLYSWDNPADGWDGKFHGKDVKQGVYFVLVKAKGADGIKYNIKRDVNLLRGFSENTNNKE